MRRLLSLTLVAFAALILAASGAAATDAEQQLADKYAPVVGLKEQPEACAKTGEPYRPVPADVVL